MAAVNNQNELATVIDQVTSKFKQATKTLQTPHAFLYFVGFSIFGLIWQSFHDIGLSTLLTFSVLIQVVALAALLLAIALRKSAEGVSIKSIQMQALSFVMRLCCTSWLRGYIPIDSTGDWLYQLGDFTALCLCIQIWYAAHFRFAETYDVNADSFRVTGLIVLCIFFAILVHPDLNNRPFFDALWTAALYVDVVSTLPQLHMMSKCQGKTVDALSCHYVFLLVISRMTDAIFWYHGYPELAPEKGGINIAGYSVMGAHFLHLLLNADFVWCYGKQVLSGRAFDKHLDFSASMELV